MFAREGLNRSSVYRRSPASLQVLFLLERSLTYHCAWHLRLAESWMPFRFSEVGSALTSFPRAALGYLLSPLSFARLRTLFVWSLVLFPKSFSSLHLLRVERGAVVLESVCLLSCARHWYRNPAGTTHVVRLCFQRLQADVCMSFPRACTVAVFCRRGHSVCKANLLSAVSRCNVLRCLVVRGHHSTNSPIC